jgi:predicted GTPase
MSRSEAISIDEVIEKALSLCQKLPANYRPIQTIIQDCKNRLSSGSLHLAVMGMFKRGKSSFVNSLLGFDILPTSVVPVTSVPTVIKYGDTLRLSVRFFNNKPDLIVQESAKAVHDCLLTHVAEEHNPLNRRCVEEAIVDCPNPLLKNGTMFIDTPGFGSTYTHNTKTTLDLLRKCDAVLFLLSPDPPFTQTEVEFLKEVRKAVSRIFFILNKIDLLTIDDLNTIDKFIQSILTNNLGFPANTRVFHVSAKIGKVVANRPENDPAWRLSGMAAIRTEIIDFMVREKYFTLSQAIDDKFKEALSQAQSQLEAERRELLSPAENAASEHATFAQDVSSIRSIVDKELGMMDIEIKALGEFAGKTIDGLKIDLQRKASESLRVVLESVPLKKSGLSYSVNAAFEQQAKALFDHFFIQVVSAINKPLKKAVLLHCNEIIKLSESAKKSNPSLRVSLEELESLVDDLEIKADSPWKLEGANVAFQQIKLPFCGFFPSEKTKRQRFRDCYARAVTEIVNLNIIRFTMLVNELILSSYKKLKKALGDWSEDLLSSMGRAMEEKKRNLDNMESGVANRVMEIEKQKQEFKEVEDMLI